MARRRQEDEPNIETGDDGSDEQEADSQRQCLLCGQVPESIICLTCGHNIDIPCATRVILETQTGDEPDISKLDCLICGQVTHLSPEVQAAIIAYGEGEQEDGYEEGIEEIDEGEEEMNGQEEEVYQERTEEQSFRENEDNSNRKSGHSRAAEPSGIPTSKKQSVNEMKESVSNTNPNEISLHFACLVHPNEEYAYYSANTRRLYCAQCLLDERKSEGNRDLKSIKRSLPIIGQHLQEMVNSVETSRGLIGNRRKDAEIKVDDLTVRLQSLKYKTELKFDELAERVLVCKQQFSEGFAQKSVTFLEEVQGLADQFDEKISYLDAVIEQIDKMRSNDEEEDLLGFYFANQEKISSFLAEDNDQRMMNRIRSSCDHAESKMKGFIEVGLNEQYQEIENVTKEIFAFKATRSIHSSPTDAIRTDENPRLMDINFSAKNIFKRAKERISESMTQENLSKTPNQKSSFFSKATPQYFHLSTKYKQGNKTPDANEKTSMTAGFSRSVAQSKPPLTDTNAYFEILKDRELRQQVTQEIRREPTVVIGNPFSGLEKKLAMFDIRNPARPKSSYLNRTATQDISAPPTRIERKNTDSNGRYCTHETPNVESLRFFRQRIRDRFTKDLNGLRRNLFTY